MIKALKIGVSSIVLSLFISTNVYASTEGIVTADILNIRSTPSTSSIVVGKTYYGEKLNIISQEGNWYKIMTASNSVAYVSGDFIKTTTENTSTPAVAAAPTSTSNVQVGYVDADILNLRSAPSIANNIIAKLSQSEKVNILSEQGEWYYVSTTKNLTGYVSSTYINLSEPSSPSTTAISTNQTEVRSQIVTYAKQFLGNPYVYGGTSLTNGIDCSSFTQQILGKFNYKISRASYQQINDGIKISSDELLPGDLVFYGYFGVVSHVGMYIGDGKIIHASSPSTGILISGVFTQGKKPLIGCRRVIG